MIHDGLRSRPEVRGTALGNLRRRFVAVALLILALASLSGCGSGGSGPVAERPTDTGGPTESEEVRAKNTTIMRD